MYCFEDFEISRLRAFSNTFNDYFENFVINIHIWGHFNAHNSNKYFETVRDKIIRVSEKLISVVSFQKN